MRLFISLIGILAIVYILGVKIFWTIEKSRPNPTLSYQGVPSAE